MSENTSGKIAFEVETGRILELLSREIYDSPLALLRENVQNAYDAVLMRSVLEGLPVRDGTIDIRVEPLRLTISDTGIGMTEEVLRDNFWKAGSSGKKTELAAKSGVIGTFGIGAMANFGVCTSLRVETRPVNSRTTFVSIAERANLSISKDCIDLIRLTDDRQPGTTLIVELDGRNPLTEASAKAYLLPYVTFLPVKVHLNGQLISQGSYEQLLADRSKGCHPASSRLVSAGVDTAHVEVLLDPNGNVFAKLRNIKVQGVAVSGEMLLAQNCGQLFGMRSSFGLAPIPIATTYQLGGYANLSFLQPTAGREALSRDSIEAVGRLVNLAEAEVTKTISEVDAADRNPAFLHYVASHGLYKLAGNVRIEVRPGDESVKLSQAQDHCKGKRVYYYTGRDLTTVQTFANDQSRLLQVSQANPRRQVQLQYIRSILGIEEVPDKATVIRAYKPNELSTEEVSFLFRIVSILNDDYLLSNAEASFAEITHGVLVLVSKPKETVVIQIARNSSIVRPVLECYRTAYEVFSGFVKDFVRNQLYQRLSQYVPSSTKEGADALARMLQRNRELYRLEESDSGDLEPLLGDYLTGKKSFAEVLIASRSARRPYAQRVSSEQVGTVEQAMPDVIESPSSAEQNVEGREYQAAPPILRLDLQCNLKILTTGARYPQLNNFELFLGLSDRLVKREGDFFHGPHTTKVIWGGHRIIYIFTDATTKITIYYDIELKEPLQETAVAGGMLPTTTLVTKDRIYVPVPDELVDAFRLVGGAKEFYVRFDMILS